MSELYLQTSATAGTTLSNGESNDTYLVDARFLSFDFHVQIDSLGSRQKFIK